MYLKSIPFLSRFQLQRCAEYADKSNTCRNVCLKRKRTLSCHQLHRHLKMLAKKAELPQHCVEVSGRSCVPVTFPLGTDSLYWMNTRPDVLNLLEKSP